MTEVATLRNVLCVVVDRLQAGMIGAYGNTWIQTPGFDQLAAESLTCERALIDSPDLELTYRAYWQGLHAMMPSAAGRDVSLALPSRLTQAGYTTVLIADDSLVVEHLGAGGFAQRTLVEVEPVEHQALEIDDTQLARLFAVAAQRISELGELAEPFCLWLHAGSLGRVWDAPAEFRGRYAEEDDPTPTDSVDVRNYRLPEDFDPDELLKISQAYAGQVALVDACLSGLLDSLAAMRAADSTLVLVLGSRGFPLGEHGSVGFCDASLYSELTQVPWMMHIPDGKGASERSQALVQSADAWATIADWCRLEQASSLGFPAAGRSLLPLASTIPSGELPRSGGMRLYPRDRACIAGPGERAIVTPAWFLRTKTAEATTKATPESADDSKVETATANPPPNTELFAKPEDRFEVNEVSNRAVEVVAELLQSLAQFEHACQSESPEALLPLSDILVSGVD